MTIKPLTVVKCGGNPAVDAAGICADIAGLVHEKHSILLVHGGSGEIGRLADRLGVAQRTLVAPDGVFTRHTDPETLEVVVLALAGAVKPKLVAELSRHKVPAVGLTGMDGGMLRARRKAAVRAVVDGRTVLIRNNHSGRITTVNTELLETLLHAGYVPVISPPGIDEHDHPSTSTPTAPQRHWPRRSAPTSSSCSPAHPEYSPIPTNPPACKPLS